jgi:hypothetical protein
MSAPCFATIPPLAVNMADLCMDFDNLTIGNFLHLNNIIGFHL